MKINKGFMSIFIFLLLGILVFLGSIVGVKGDGEDDGDIHVEDDPESGAEITEKGSDDGQHGQIEEINYVTPQLDQHKVLFYESFDEKEFWSNWILSKATKHDSSDHKYDGQWETAEAHPRLKGSSPFIIYHPWLSFLLSFS